MTNRIEIEKNSPSGGKVPVALNNLSDVNVVEITLTKGPAVPRGTFTVLKSDKYPLPEGNEVIIKTLAIKSIDKIKKQVFGYCLGPDDPDHQGDVMSAEEVEKACHSFMKNLAHREAKGTGSGLEHLAFEGIGYPIQSAIDYNGSVGKSAGTEGWNGGWWIGVQVDNDEIWSDIEKGEITGFSIGGDGKREAIDKTKKSAVTVVWERLNKIIAGLKKSEDAVSFLEAFRESQIREDLWDMFSALENSIRSILEDDETGDKAGTIATTIDQFKNAMLAFVSIVKSDGQIKDENKRILIKAHTLLEGIAKQVKETKDGLKYQLSKNQIDTGDGTMPEVTKEQMDELTKTLTELGTTMKDMGERVGKIEEARKSDGDPPDGDPANKSEEGKEKDGELGELTKTLKKMTEEMGAVVKRIETLEKTPVGKNSDTEPPAAPGDGNKDKETGSGIEKKLAGTAFQFFDHPDS